MATTCSAARRRPGATAPMPVRAPMPATLGSPEALGDDGDSGFETNQSGARAPVAVDDGQVWLLSGNDIDTSVAYPETVPVGQALPGPSAVLDVEIVAFDPEGRPSFWRLQERMHMTDATADEQLAASDPTAPLPFDLQFDLLFLDGGSFLAQPCTKRRSPLDALGLSNAAWPTPRAFSGGGADALAFSRHPLERLVARRRGSTSQPARRPPSWES